MAQEKNKKKTKKIKTEGMLIIDIGTASVGAAFVKEGPHDAPLLEHVVRTPIGTGSNSSRDALLTHTEEALKELLAQYSSHVPKDIHVVVSTPWHEAHIRTITSSSEKPTHISKRTALSAVQKYQNEKPPVEGNVDVEAVAIQVQVNGYSTSLRRTVSGKEISINLYESEMSASIHKKFLSIVETIFPNSAIAFNTFPLVAATSLRTVTEQTGFIIADVTGEATEVAIVYNDGVRHIGSFPVGYYSIARSVSIPESEGVADAMSRLALLARGELAAEEEQRINKAFNESFLAWSNGLKEIISVASEKIPIPRLLYLLSDKEPLTWIRKGAEEQNPYHLHVIPFGAPEIQNFLEVGENAHYDVFLSLSALFFHIANQELIGESKELDVVYSR